MEGAVEWIDAATAAERLGVKPATLYAYVSRGVLRRRHGEDGRRSFFDAAEVEQLARRGGRATRPPSWSSSRRSPRWESTGRTTGGSTRSTSPGGSPSRRWPRGCGTSRRRTRCRRGRATRRGSARRQRRRGVCRRGCCRSTGSR
ncbi:helix-turn-helix transcriptional regulator [Nonomuraea dietziae]|uniref:helix-turn-helix transcriptional regulator n=1 Tax=Nonomuraea dietziae TaxID=65515 RepID=UPI0036190417